MDNFYGWLEGGIFCLDGYGYGVTKSGRTVSVGKTEDLIKEHPPAPKAEPVMRRPRISKKGGKR
ncbi:hypothetical protein LCGC14_0350060 [marine sediment metagenome]|uniref:Uncharacterized protein n=1 Tax=marine sediment metagenome TaxID=412755 RepID=A0A0F9TGT9_9ZZZZ